MNIRFTLDTNILSYYLKGNDSIAQRLKKEILDGNQFIINPIFYYEIHRGLLIINSHEKLRKFKALCQIFSVAELSLNALDIASQEYAKLRKKGKLIEDADIFIAAVCIANDLTLITNNEKYFLNIEGLNIENWIE